MASRESILKKGVSDTILLARVCRRHLGCRVDSALVDPGASLVDHARIAHNVEVRANVSIGRWTYIEPRTFANGAEIGAFCGIGRNVAIDCFKHPYTHPPSLRSSPVTFSNWTTTTPPRRRASAVTCG